MTDQIPVPDDQADEDFLPRRALLDRIDAAIAAGDAGLLNTLLEPMHGADIADIIERLTPAERRDPDIISGSRKRRIAMGSGTQVQDIGRLIKQHKQMQKMLEIRAKLKEYSTHS